MEGANSGGFSAVACDHAMNPRNHGPLKDYSGVATVTGPCGDTMQVWVSVRDGKIERVSFTTDGCGSSLACGSMATSLALGKPVEDAAALQQQDVLDALGDFPRKAEHCALLAAMTLRAACEDYMKHHHEASHDVHG